MDDLYVNIDEPSQKRRVLLQSSRDMLGALKLLEEFLEMKEQKKELFNKVSSIFDDIARLNNNLHSKLPRAGAEKIPERVPSLPKFKIKEPEEAVSTARTKLDILEEELSAIEAKIGRIE